MTKKVYIKSFGCQMNEYDSELIHSILAEAGYTFTDNEREADIILLNTCAVRDSAQRKVFNIIHTIKRARDGRPAVYGILGCIATHLKHDLFNTTKLKIDLVAGPDSYKRLPELITQALKENETVFDVNLSDAETYADIYPRRDTSVNAWVAITRGCDNFCTFCVVPYTRGRERSRSPENILAEIEKLVREGVKQVTLLGQNVNSYSSGGCDFSALLEKAAAIDGLERLRFMSPHPKDFPDKLLEIMAGHKNICKHIHFPLQAGSDRILKLMNRSYTTDKYLQIISAMKKKIPHIALTTDIIVGFPTETDREFEDTVGVMKEVEFDSAFIFKYSERPGTIAAKKFKDDVPEGKKTERIVILNELQKQISLQKNRAHIGEIREVLIEKKGTARSENDFQGRTDGNVIVILPSGNYSPGNIIQAKIISATAHSLRGEVLPAN